MYVDTPMNALTVTAEKKNLHCFLIVVQTKSLPVIMDLVKFQRCVNIEGKEKQL